MMAINHAMTGAVLGLYIDSPLIALPLAFASHFALDAVPHYDPVDGTNEQKISSRAFFYQQIVLGALLCGLLVLGLVLARPRNWLTACFAAFLAASPDLLSVPRFLSVKKTGRDIVDRHWFWRFHSWIQWRTGQRLLWVELLWLAVTTAVLWHRL